MAARLPTSLRSGVQRAIADMSARRSVFVMMRYQETPQFEEIVTVIGQTLRAHGLQPRLARDKAYSRDLWENVRIYMHACNLGIAVFEEIDTRSFNPNVAIEVGYMSALGKHVLLLKERRMPVMPTDIVGQIYRSFDSYQIRKTITTELGGWLRDDLGLNPMPIVLVVDDDDATRNVIGRAVEDQGCEVVTANDGLEALEAIRVREPDLILLDDLMPNLDGFASLPEIRRLTDAPVLFIGVVEAWRFQQGLLNGADDFILKPFDLNELEARVFALLRRRGRPPRRDLL